MLNKTVLIGRLTKDPELKYTPSGIAVARFTLAINRPVFSKTDKSNSDGAGDANSSGQEADFIRVVAWRRLAEICSEYLAKGRLVYIEGRLQIDSYEKNGARIYTSEVVADNMQMLERKGTLTDNGAPASSATALA